MEQSTYEEANDPTRLCFYCDRSAVVHYSAALTSAYPGGTDGLDILLGKVAATRGVLTIGGDACEAHRDALADALMGCLDVGGVSGESLTRSTCPDPWHEDEDAYENTETAPTPVGGGPWVETHYECPTCGFSTLSSSVMVTPDDPAYRYVKAAIERV